MVKKLNPKKILIIVALAIVLFIGTYDHIYPFKDINSSFLVGMELPFGWKTVSDMNNCGVTNYGWPYQVNRGFDCTITGVNHFALVADSLLALIVYMIPAVALVYGFQFSKHRLARK